MRGCWRLKQHLRKRRRSSREAGFTLIEMLASLILLAAAAALLPGALHLGTRAMRAAEPPAQGAASLPLRDFLLTRLAEARPQMKPAATRETGLDFSGSATALTFVAPAAQSDRRHGLLRYRIARGAEDGRLRALMWDPGQPASASPVAEALLSETPARVSFRYFGRRAQDEEAAWHDAWIGETVLPRLVEIAIAAEGTQPVPIIAQVRLAPPD